ncbi:c-type cytochrome [Pararhizobium haloflavum]|uniref:c-type cytochrome n=1 Tax=Pararhizobium haloflavum TaxID=2037914 RepID=UPI000DEEA33F|nr:c-type cytochrome [Pararhizobium haloflavum]
MRLMSKAAVLIGGAVMLSLGAAGAQEEAEGDNWEDKPYIIEDGKVDYGVYNGFRRYHNTCHTCHGPDAMGSTFAPALVESLKDMSYADFTETVVNGRQSSGAGGSTSVMPSFGENPDVMLYIDHIYAYLKARADGEVARGRPERLDPENDPVFQEYQESQ